MFVVVTSHCFVLCAVFSYIFMQYRFYRTRNKNWQICFIICLYVNWQSLKTPFCRSIFCLRRRDCVFWCLNVLLCKCQQIRRFGFTSREAADNRLNNKLTSWRLNPATSCRLGTEPDLQWPFTFDPDLTRNNPQTSLWTVWIL